MFVEWEKLLTIKYNTPLDQIGFQLIHLRDHIYKLNSNQYIFAENLTYGEDRLKYFGFIWTDSKGTAEWIFMKNSLADEGLKVLPPLCLLPNHSISSYRDLIKHGKEKFPENFSDTVTGQTRVSFGDHTYFFRKCFPLETDFPIAVGIDLRPDKDFFPAF